MMQIEFDRRYAFYFDHEGQAHPFSADHLDRLWRGEPDAAMPELAGLRVRFALLHIERFTTPPHVVLEHYPVLTFDAEGNLDVQAQYEQLQADVDRLEANDYQPIAPTTHESPEPSSEWRPDPATRRRLVAATRTPARLTIPPSRRLARCPAAGPSSIPAPATTAPFSPTCSGSWLRSVTTRMSTRP
jgi:hypothetical protein